MPMLSPIYRADIEKIKNKKKAVGFLAPTALDPVI